MDNVTIQPPTHASNIINYHCFLLLKYVIITCQIFHYIAVRLTLKFMDTYSNTIAYKGYWIYTYSQYTITILLCMRIHTHTFPQPRQWCRRNISLNGIAQTIHMLTLLSCIHTGAFIANLSSFIIIWSEGWTQIQTSRYTNTHYNKISHIKYFKLDIKMATIHWYFTGLSIYLVQNIKANEKLHNC